MFIKNFFFIFIFLLFSSCSIANKKNENLIAKPEIIPSAEKLYSLAIKDYSDGKYRSSIKSLLKIQTRYSFSDFAPKAVIMTMFIYYENNDYFNTLKYAKQFISLYPAHKNIDYVNFIVAMTFYEQIQTSSRDQTYTEAALKEFKKIIKNYPNSKYSEESKYKIDLINEQLAGKQMYIARFYMKKSKWISAIKRLNIVLNDYPTTIFTVEALHRLVEIYYKLGNVELAKRYAAILGYNFNDSDWYKKTYKVVSDKNYGEETKKSKLKILEKLKKIFISSE